MNAPISGKAAAPAIADFIALNEEIAALVRARVPLESNLARVGAQMPGKAGELAQHVGRRLEAGETLIDAIDAECKSLPATYRAVLAAGDQSGNLAGALEAIVDSASRLDQLRRITALSIIYPIAIFILVCFLLTILIKIVAPSFDWLENSRLHVFATLSHSPWVAPILSVAIPCLVLLTTAAWWWSTGRLSGAGWPRTGLLALLTGAGRVYRWSEATRFAEMLLLLVERGLPLQKSLQITAEATHDRRLRRAAENLASQIQAGDVATDAQSPHDPRQFAEFPALIRLALHHADARDLFVSSLRQAAAMYRERAIRAADWYAEYLPILLTIFVGGTFTVVFTLLVIWPYTSMLHDISRWDWK